MQQLRNLSLGYVLSCLGFFLLGMSAAFIRPPGAAMSALLPVLAGVLAVVGYLVLRPALKASRAARQ